MSDLSRLIADCIEIAKAAHDDDYFLLERRDGRWRAEAVRLTGRMIVGELCPAFRGSGDTPEEAVANLMAAIRRRQQAQAESSS